MAKIDFEKWDREMDSSYSDKHQLSEQMTVALKSNEQNVDVLWRLSRVNIYLSKEALNREYFKTKVAEALRYADLACHLDPRNFNCHKWYCASVGKMSALVGSKDKIRCGHEFKEHADIAMQLNPNDWYMLLMYGRWCYEVASLSWFERKLASTLIATPPIATYEEALHYLRRSDELHPMNKETYLWIAKILLATKQKNEAKVWIDNGCQLSNINNADTIAHQELLQLKNKS